MFAKNIFFFAFFGFAIMFSSAFGAELKLEYEYLKGEQVYDLCEWKGSIWASTNTGLYRLEENEAIQVAIPVKSNDRITSLYNGSPYALVCGTFQGDLLFITQDKNNYCQAVWSLSDLEKNNSFYVNSVAQNKQGVWLGTLEKGVLLYKPDIDSLFQFSLDYNDDSIGINIYDFEASNDDITWVLAQDGLYFIMNVFGEKNELQYVKSQKINKKPYALDVLDKTVFLAYNQGNGNYLGKTKFGKHAFDLRITKKKKIPSGFIKAIQVLSIDDFWILTDKISHVVNDRIVDYYIKPSNQLGITTKDMVLAGDYIYVSTAENGILKYALKEKVLEEESNRFNANKITLGKNLELDLVFFAPGDSVLSTASYNQLSELTKALENDTALKVELMGHTALDGDPIYLKTLSLSRANAVKSFLLANGIKPDRITTFGMGAENLKVLNNPKSPKNRRVEILLIH